MLPDSMHVPAWLDLTDNTRLIGFRLARNNHRPANEALAAQQCEPQGLLGSNGDASLIDVRDSGLRHALLEVVDDVWVVRTTSAHIYLIHTILRSPAFVRVSQRLRSDAGDGRYTVLRSGSG